MANLLEGAGKRLNDITPQEWDAVTKKGTDRQVGGDHYRQGGIEPIHFITSNNIPFMEANVIKYVFRHKLKNGVQDLEKAKHYLDMLIELSKGEKNDS